MVGFSFLLPGCRPGRGFWLKSAVSAGFSLFRCHVTSVKSVKSVIFPTGDHGEQHIRTGHIFPHYERRPQMQEFRLRGKGNGCPPSASPVQVPQPFHLRSHKRDPPSSAAALPRRAAAKPNSVMIAAIRRASAVPSLSIFSKSSADLATWRIVVCLTAGGGSSRPQPPPHGSALVALGLFRPGHDRARIRRSATTTFPCGRVRPLQRTTDRGRCFSAAMSILPALHRPEPAAAGFVAQISILVSGADENALPRLDHFQPPIGRTKTL